MSTGELRLRREALEWREVEGEIVALDLDSAEYLAANPSGAVLWRELATGSTCEKLVQALVQEFDVDEDTATRDVERFLGKMRGRGLLV